MTEAKKINFITVEIDDNKCNKCYDCIDFCPTEALRLEQTRFIHDAYQCSYCEICMDVCDQRAIQILEMEIMEIIKFKDHFYQSIKNGSKTQTMRMSHKRVDVKEDEYVIGRFKTFEDVLLKISKVGYKMFKSINDEDAKREGFNSADELKQELLEIYNDVEVLETSRFYYYQFKFKGFR